MSRSARRLLAGALALLLPLAVPAGAVIEGGPHDLISQGYDVVKVSSGQERCSRCHLPFSEGPAFLPDVPPVLAASYSVASITCFSCHDGTTIVSVEVDASRTAFNPASHGGRMAKFEGAGVEEAGLPFLAGERVECATCHDPHDNGNRPFLRSEIGRLCLLCHSLKSGFGRGEKNQTGNHPQGPDPVTLERKEAPLKVQPAFKTPFPSGYPLAGGRTSVGTHWDLGGHLSGGAEGTVACVTCHAVHGDERQSPTPTLLTMSSGGDLADPLCEGCHAGKRGDSLQSPALPNPGGTTTGRTYHPCDDDAANGEGRIVEVTVPPGWPLGGGTPPRLLCSTCHAAHDAQPATAILRQPPQGAGFCESCHAGGTLLPYHHSTAAGGECDKYLPARGESGPSGVRCDDCHRAHNAGLGAADERRFVPLLRGEPAQDDCLRCHPQSNPTCDALPEASASHYMGDPLVDYNDKAPPLWRNPWPESGLLSGYGGAGGMVYGDPLASGGIGSGTTVTCLSCHSFRKGSLVSGDLGDTAHLLAKSGNPVQWTAEWEANYLCTGCHTSAPSTGDTKGHTHPLMNANGAKLGRDPVAPVSLTAEGHVNCDSCHRAHRASTKGGYYILEDVNGQNTDPRAIHPSIDFTPLCHHCHDPKDY